MLSKNNLMLSPTARRLDSRLADEECVLALEKTTPRNPPQQNLYFVFCATHCVPLRWRNFAAESSATDFSLCQAWSSRVCQYQPWYWSTMISPLKSGSIYAVLDNICSLIGNRGFFPLAFLIFSLSLVILVWTRTHSSNQPEEQVSALIDILPPFTSRFLQ